MLLWYFKIPFNIKNNEEIYSYQYMGMKILIFLEYNNNQCIDGQMAYFIDDDKNTIYFEVKVSIYMMDNDQ